MGTVLQKNLAQEIVKNAKNPNPKNKTELLESAGYSGRTAISSQKRTLSQKGVKEELEILGFDENTAKQVVRDIMLDKRVKVDARLKATDQVFKVQGSYAPEKRTNVNVNVISKEDKAKIDRILGIK